MPHGAIEHLCDRPMCRMTEHISPQMVPNTLPSPHRLCHHLTYIRREDALGPPSLP